MGEGAVKSLNDANQLASDQHPADALGETLGRINTLLSAMGAMFEPSRESFAVNETFVMHSLLATQDLVVAAQNSLNKLHDNCDLTLLSDALAAEARAGEAKQQAAPAKADVVEEDLDYADSEPLPYTPLSTAARFVEQVKAAAANTEFAEIMAPSQTDDRRALQDGFAQNYLELLRKLTAAEIFAAEQQALSPPGTQHQLLPLLKSLREDFQRIHSAA